MTRESRPQAAPESSATTTSTIIATRDVTALKYGLSAVYVRDPDPLSVALRKMRRRRPLNGSQLAAYEAWLAEQRQDAS